jgi:AcrR family transcriptional regulator
MPNQSTEQAILDAARTVFVEQGPNARMTDVAEEAGLNQSLLHYYFRRRKNLYQTVFEEELKRTMPAQADVLKSDRPLPEKLHRFARNLIDFHADNPHLAAFILFEINYNNENFETIQATLLRVDFGVLQQQIDQRVEQGKMEPVDVRHLLAHLFSLCLFPFLAKPIFQLIYDLDEAAFDAFIEERKEAVPAFIDRALGFDR